MGTLGGYANAGLFLRGGKWECGRLWGMAEWRALGGGRQSRAALPLSKLGNVPAN